MKLPIKKIWIVTGAILLLLILLNPGIARFKEYSGLIGKDSHYIKRTYNFIIFSIYEDTYNDKKYIGVLMNFINVTPQKIVNEASSSEKSNYSDTMTIEKIPSFEDVMVGPAYKTMDHRTYTKHQLLTWGYTENRIRTGVYNGVLIPIETSYILNDKKMQLWNILGEMDLYKESYEDFKKKYSTSDSVAFLFNGLSNDKLYTKSREDFYKEYFPDAIPPFDPNKPYTIVKDSTK